MSFRVNRIENKFAKTTAPLRHWVGNHFADIFASEGAKLRQVSKRMQVEFEFYIGRAIKLLKRSLQIHILFAEVQGIRRYDRGSSHDAGRRPGIDVSRAAVRGRLDASIFL